MRARTIVVGMSIVLVAMACLVEQLSQKGPSPLAWLLRQEVVHLLAHTVLYGSLAVALAQWKLAPLSEAPRRHRWSRVAGAVLCFLAIAGTQELVQVLYRGRPPGREEIFDLFVDVVAACAGLIVWTGFQRRFQRAVARALGVLLHPVFVGPVGVFALTWSSTRDSRNALRWTLQASAAAVPVMVLWALGLRRGFFSDVDLSIRRERPAFLLVAFVMAATFAAMVYRSGAPPMLRTLALAGFLASAIFTLVTAAGLKASGHAAVPVGVLILLEATSHRGMWPFAMVALAVSWARIQEGRHTPHEIAAGWSIAGASAWFARQML
jgi:VanZ family protein